MDKTKKKVAIISGVNSFLGKNTATYLIKKGFIVFGIIRPNCYGENDLKLIKKLKIIKLDFDSLCFNAFTQLYSEKENNIETFKTIQDIKSTNADISFIDFAWGHTLDRNNFAMQMLNIDLSFKILEFAKIIGAKRFIFAGSQAEKSESAYGMAKKQFAKKAVSYLKKDDMKFIHFRIYSVYGKNDRETSLLKQLIKSFKENKDFILSSCEYMWNYLYIDDFVEILYKFIMFNIKSGVYDIASCDTRLLKSYVEEAHMLCKAKNKLVFGGRPDSTEKFAVPSIKNTLDVIGKYQFTKFSKGILNLM